MNKIIITLSQCEPSMANNEAESEQIISFGRVARIAFMISINIFINRYNIRSVSHICLTFSLSLSAQNKDRASRRSSAMPQQHISQLPRLGTLVSSLDGHQRVNLQCRVVLLGAAKVGKTAIVEQFLYDAFPVLHSATVEQLYRAEYQVRGAGKSLIKYAEHAKNQT